MVKETLIKVRILIYVGSFYVVEEKLTCLFALVLGLHQKEKGG